jgi:hypothetical protein
MSADALLTVRKVMMKKIAFFIAAIALGSAAVSSDGLARGGAGGGHSGDGLSTHDSADEFEGVPGLTPQGTFEANTPEGRSAAGLNFNNQLRNGATGAQPNANSNIQPQGGTMNEQPDSGSSGQTDMNSMP